MPATPDHAESRLDRWQHRADLPLTFAALLFLAAYAWPVLQPDLPGAWHTTLSWVSWIAWAAFVVDYAARLHLTTDRLHFLRTNVVGLLVIALPLLRPLRSLRLITVLSTLNRRAGTSLRGRVITYVAGSVTLVLFIAAVAVLDAERHDPDANIQSFPDALWWAVTTVTTVGYGDRFPVTGEGRLVAAGLMVAGIALLGIVTASIAAWLVDRVREVEEQSEAATRRDIEALVAEVTALRAELAARDGFSRNP